MLGFTNSIFSAQIASFYR